MTYTTIIQVRQLIDCFYLVVFLWVIEPSRTDRNVTLGSDPLISIGMTVL